MRGAFEWVQACTNAPLPSIDKAISAMKPRAPLLIMNRVLRWGYRGAWLRASRPFGPGVSARPHIAVRKISQVCRAIRQAFRGGECRTVPACLCYSCRDWILKRWALNAARAVSQRSCLARQDLDCLAAGFLEVIVGRFLGVGTLVVHQLLSAIHQCGDAAVTGFRRGGLVAGTGDQWRVEAE